MSVASSHSSAHAAPQQGPQDCMLPDGQTFSIVVEPPTFEGWTGFNRKCEELDSDFLMQPINEADYDSETQCLVDRNNDGPTSFYDHFVTKRKKKRGLRGPTEAPVKSKYMTRDGMQNLEPAASASAAAVTSAALAALAAVHEQHGDDASRARTYSGSNDAEDEEEEEEAAENAAGLQKKALTASSHADPAAMPQSRGDAAYRDNDDSDHDVRLPSRVTAPSVNTANGLLDIPSSSLPPASSSRQQAAHDRRRQLRVQRAKHAHVSEAVAPLDSAAGETLAVKIESPQAKQQQQPARLSIPPSTHAVVAGGFSRKASQQAQASSSSVAAPSPAVTVTVDHLDAPRGSTLQAPPKGSLSNPAVRRIACGVMPPMYRVPPGPAVFTSNNNNTSTSSPSSSQNSCASWIPPPPLAHTQQQKPSAGTSVTSGSESGAESTAHPQRKAAAKAAAAPSNSLATPPPPAMQQAPVPNFMLSSAQKFNTHHHNSNNLHWQSAPSSQHQLAPPPPPPPPPGAVAVTSPISSMLANDSFGRRPSGAQQPHAFRGGVETGDFSPPPVLRSNSPSTFSGRPSSATPSHNSSARSSPIPPSQQQHSASGSPALATMPGSRGFVLAHQQHQQHQQQCVSKPATPPMSASSTRAIEAAAPPLLITGASPLHFSAVAQPSVAAATTATPTTSPHVSPQPVRALPALASPAHSSRTSSTASSRQSSPQLGSVSVTTTSGATVIVNASPAVIASATAAAASGAFSPSPSTAQGSSSTSTSAGLGSCSNFLLLPPSYAEACGRSGGNNESPRPW